uniref:Uncharacterized protein n=1 Tax=Rhizophora mucronata TaxID=61149 RepID=A0A2P2QED9_RHIMU
MLTRSRRCRRHNSAEWFKHQLKNPLFFSQKKRGKKTHENKATNQKKTRVYSIRNHITNSRKQYRDYLVRLKN